MVIAAQGFSSAGQRVLAPENARTAPPQGRAPSHTRFPVLTARRRVPRVMGPRTAALSRGRMAHQDVFTAGTGTAESRAVTRAKNALTGQDVGRWRRIRSLYCLT